MRMAQGKMNSEGCHAILSYIKAAEEWLLLAQPWGCAGRQHRLLLRVDGQVVVDGRVGRQYHVRRIHSETIGSSDL